MTDKEEIIIDVDEYFKSVTDDYGRPITYVVNHNDLREEIITLNKEFARKTQECEELEDKLKTYEKMFDSSEYRVALTDIRTGERDIREQRDKRLTKENDRYRKALEEIEEVCLEDTYTFADGTQIRYDSLNDILDIINKAKGEE